MISVLHNAVERLFDDGDLLLAGGGLSMRIGDPITATKVEVGILKYDI